MEQFKIVIIDWCIVIFLLTIYSILRGLSSAVEVGIWHFVFVASLLYLVVNFFRFKLKDGK